MTRGRIGSEIYGLDPYVTTNLTKPSAGQGNNFVGHRDAYALVMQRSPQMHLFYDIDYHHLEGRVRADFRAAANCVTPSVSTCAASQLDKEQRRGG